MQTGDTPSKCRLKSPHSLRPRPLLRSAMREQRTDPLSVPHVNPHWHVIAQRSPRFERANSEVRDPLHPAARQEDVVQVKRPLFPVPEIICGASLGSLLLAEIGVIRADDAPFAQKFYHRGMLANFSTRIETRIAV